MQIYVIKRRKAMVKTIVPIVKERSIAGTFLLTSLIFGAFAVLTLAILLKPYLSLRV